MTNLQHDPDINGTSQDVDPSPRAGWRWLAFSVVAALGIAAGFVAGRYGFQNEATRQYAALKSDFDVTVAQNKHDLNDALSKLDIARGQLSVEESTRRALEATLMATQNELGRVREQLAFFDQLLPPGPAGAISVRALEIEQRGAMLQYRVLLMRNAPGGDAFNGTMQFVANGEQGGKAVKMTLQPAQLAMQAVAADNNAQDALGLTFEKFQRSGGLLAVPEGFMPKTVTLNILEGKNVRVSRTVNLALPE